MIFDSRIGAYAWVERDGLVLLTLWEGAPERGVEPRWGLPGGGVEWGEQVEEATIREVREETGYDVTVGTVLAVGIVHIAPEERLAPGEGPLRLVRVVTSATITGGDLTHEIDGSTLRAAWFTREHIASLPREHLLDWALAALGGL